MIVSLGAQASPLSFQPALVVFDKDGTLIDFNFMWATWISELARQVESASNLSISELLFRTMGYDPEAKRALAGSPLAICSMAELRKLLTQIIERAGMSHDDAESIAEKTWFVPDPVARARPLGDLPRVLYTLRARNIHTAVVTSDDREPTLATLAALGIRELTEALVCANDGLPNKPAPDMILRACEILNVSPRRAVLVGDAVADMQAGRAAGVGVCIGVLSGLTTREMFAAHADVILPNVNALIENADC